MNRKRLVAIAVGIVLVLFVANSRAHSQSAQRNAAELDWRGPTKEHPVKVVDIPSGNGAATREEAKKNAFREAAKKIEAELRKQKYPFVWFPSGDYVREHLWDKVNIREEPVTVGNSKVLMRVGTVLDFSISTEAYQRLIAEDQRHRWQEHQNELRQKSEMRMLLLAKIMAFVFVGLVLIQAYYRLEIHTRGYLTGWLIFGVVVSLLVAGGVIVCLL